MNMSFETSGSASQTEKFVYQDASFVSADSTDRHAGPQLAGRGATSPHISEEELSRLLAESRAEGFREGQEHTRAALEQQLKQERQKVANAVAEAQQQRLEYYAKVETELVHLALAIAAKILHREAQVDRLLVTGLVKVALEQLQQSTKVVVRVRPENGSAWRHVFADNPKVQIEEDASLESQACIVQTELGTADMGLDAQLKEIEQGLFDLLAQRPDAR